MACRGGLPGRWLTLAAAAACCLTPASACTVYDLFSSGLASSMWHMIPAVGLMADNGTFFVSVGPTKSRAFTVQVQFETVAEWQLCAQVNNHYFPCAPLTCD